MTSSPQHPVEDPSSATPRPPVEIRHDLRPGDLGAVVHLHGTLYASEYGFDPTFEAYVAGPMAEFVRQGGSRDRLWIAERGTDIVGCIAIVSAGSEGVRDHMGLGHSTKSSRDHADLCARTCDEAGAGIRDEISARSAPISDGSAPRADVAQLRWFLVHPSARGAGLGRRLLGEAVQFARESGYASIQLWTVSALTTAARLYRAFGFVKVEDKPGRMWGVDVMEERYVLELRAS